MRFTERIVELHRSLYRAGLPHAFGGAIALAYCTRDPRGTDDIDVNIFVGARRLPEVLDALPAAVVVTDADHRQLVRNGQSRLFWDRTPVDLFLSNHPFHGRAELRRRTRPFEGTELPVLSCLDLAVFKAFFARGKDALDIAAMVKARCIDPDELEQLVRDLIGDEREPFLADVRRFAAEPD